MKTDATPDSTNNRLHRHYQEVFNGDGATTEFRLTHTIGRLEDVAVYKAGLRMRPSTKGTANDFKVRGHTAGYDGDKNAIQFTVAPVLNAAVIVDIIST